MPLCRLWSTGKGAELRQLGMGQLRAGDRLLEVTCRGCGRVVTIRVESIGAPQLDTLALSMCLGHALCGGEVTAAVRLWNGTAAE
jgi:hypothetical protein